MGYKAWKKFNVFCNGKNALSSHFRALIIQLTLATSSLICDFIFLEQLLNMIMTYIFNIILCY